MAYRCGDRYQMDLMPQSIDAGYAGTDELEKIDQQEITVIVPSQRQALHQEEGPFSKTHFTYNKEQNC
jgi:hypothetical protein